jgi:hypothetical protein
MAVALGEKSKTGRLKTDSGLGGESKKGGTKTNWQWTWGRGQRQVDQRQNGSGLGGESKTNWQWTWGTSQRQVD